MSKCKREVDRLMFELRYTNEMLYKKETELLSCLHQSHKTTDLDTSEDSSLKRFISFLENQYHGIIVGVVGAIAGYLGDRQFASWWAKKNNIKQKTVMKLLFPTFICLIQIWLRKRNKDSKLAAFLSTLKYSSNSDTHTPHKRNRSILSLNCRPKLFSTSNKIRSPQKDLVFTICDKKSLASPILIGHKHEPLSCHLSLPHNLESAFIRSRKKSIVSINVHNLE